MKLVWACLLAVAASEGSWEANLAATEAEPAREKLMDRIVAKAIERYEGKQEGRGAAALAPFKGAGGQGAKGKKGGLRKGKASKAPKAPKAKTLKSRGGKKGEGPVPRRTVPVPSKGSKGGKGKDRGLDKKVTVLQAGRRDRADKGARKARQSKPQGQDVQKKLISAFQAVKTGVSGLNSSSRGIAA